MVQVPRQVWQGRGPTSYHRNGRVASLARVFVHHLRGTTADGGARTNKRWPGPLLLLRAAVAATLRARASSRSGSSSRGTNAGREAPVGIAQRKLGEARVRQPLRSADAPDGSVHYCELMQSQLVFTFTACCTRCC